MEERLKILQIFQFNRKQIHDYEKKISRLKLWTYFIIFYCILAWGLILSTIILDLMGNYALLNWQEAGVLVMMAIVALTFNAKIMSQIKLLKHEKFLKTQDKLDNNNNESFKVLVSKANKRFYPEIPLSIFGGLIFIAAISITVFDQNNLSITSWEYCKILIVLFLLISLIANLQLQRDLKRNINLAER